MRWKKKYNRVIKRFAFLPIRVGDEYRWLETVYIRQTRRAEWVNVMWISKEEYLKERNYGKK